MGKIKFVFLVFLLIFAFPKGVFASTREERSKEFLEWVLTKENIPPPTNNDPTGTIPVFAHLYFNRDLAAANNYLEKVQPFGGEDEDFPAIFLFRVYFIFKDSGKLTQAAKDNLLSVIRYWSDRCPSMTTWRDCCNETICEVTNSENHTIIKYSLYYLAKEYLGKNTSLAEAGIDSWISEKTKSGLIEFNSPIYTDRALMGLFTLYDFAQSPRVKTKAKMALDFYFANYALININQSRGGPAMRAYQADGAELYTDRGTDGMFEIGYLFFGHGQFPTRFHMSTAHNASTSYQVPRVIYDLATKNEEKGAYMFKTNQWQGRSIYYYISPTFVLGTVQGLQVPSVPQQTYIWSACFADSPKAVIFSNNALMQYKNTIIYDSRYNSNLAGLEVMGTDSGWYFYKGKATYVAQRQNVFFYSDQWSERRVSIMEIRESADFSSFEEFKNLIKSRQPVIDNKKITYINSFGEKIFFDTQTKEAKINDQPFSLTNYPLLESKYANSAYGSGLVEINFKHDQCLLDFRDLTNPKFTGCQSYCENWELGNLDCDLQGLINQADLDILTLEWQSSNADLNNDGKADETDLTILLANWKN